MSITRAILIKSFVKPFYRQHAGLFVFIFIALFGAVGIVDGAGLMAFHLSLVQGMFNNFSLLLLVFLVWLLYAKKTEQFFVNILRRSEFSFLQMLSRIATKKLFWLLVWIQLLLFFPIVFYMTIIFAAGIYLHAWGTCFLVLLFISALILACSGWYLYQIQHPGKFTVTKTGTISFKPLEIHYWSLFIRYIANDKKLLFTGIKIYSCVVLYLMVVNQTLVEYDLTMIFIFFSLGILSHGLLIHQLRNLEETCLSFYRTVPRSILNRYLQYALIYFILLIPEFITILILTPHYLHLKDALLFILLSYGLLLFLNSLLFIQFFKIQDYLKIILSIFLLIYFCILAATVPLLCVILFLASMAIFQNRYYQFER
jgi:hypothetical protein